MKPLGIILIILVLVAVVAVGYLYLNAKLDITFKECIATDGITQIDFFDNLKSKVDASTFIGTRFTNNELTTADQYQFLTYTLHFNNHSFLKAEVIEIRITPMQGDVLQIGEESAYDLPSGRIPLICHLHQVTAVLISFIDFIEITDPAEKMDTLDAGPVNRICDVCCICKFSLRDQSVDLIQAYF